MSNVTTALVDEAIIDVRTEPTSYRHWALTIDGAIATLSLDVDEHGGLRKDYELKLNSYDLAVDIELHDAIQRLRFEHPDVGVVILRSARERVFCAGANIRMLGQSTHHHKVNFCKFTNETRLAMEDASAHSGQVYLCALNGSAAGGGYELALAAERIVMVDDSSTAVSLPEVPLLGVLPGTGGLTRLVDKRHVRRDHADYFCTLEEGVRGERAVQWRLVDKVARASAFEDTVMDEARSLLGGQARSGEGIKWSRLERELDQESIRYGHVHARLDRARGAAEITLLGPSENAPQDIALACTQGVEFWPLALARELDDLLLHLRHNEPELGTLVISSEGDLERVVRYDDLLCKPSEHWFAREVVLHWKRVLKRLEVSSRSVFALIEPNSCFAGALLELVLIADRSFMLDGAMEDGDGDIAHVCMTPLNFGPLPSVNGLTRLATRYLDAPATAQACAEHINKHLDAQAAVATRLVTFIPDDIDWEEEVRLAIEERASFSPDALSGMEANLRIAGPETMETKIFGRLSLWQNWIFQRDNAVGEQGALSRYGSGQRSTFDKRRV